MTFEQFAVTDMTFRCFIFHWLRNSRCPIGLADFLEELGYSKEARAAQWAANVEEREDFGGRTTARKGFSPKYAPKEAWFFADDSLDGHNVFPKKFVKHQYASFGRVFMTTVDGKR